MSISREHHYVPQFYLRAFSSDDRRIGLFNFERKLFVENASIKQQCSRRNFYAFAPGLEDAFGEMEGGAASILRRIRTENALPTSEEERFALLTFIIFQNLRTAASEDRIVKMTDHMAKMMLQGSPEVASIDLERLTISTSDPIALTLSHASEVAIMATDLKFHLFVSEASRDLITSDDPVVLHNQFCEDVHHQGVLGWACSGLQVALPIGPKHLLFLFDSKIYKVGESHKGQDVSSIRDETDIRQLNLLQVLNASKNVYFRNGSEKSLSECKALAERRPRARLRFVETERMAVGEDKESSLIHHYQRLLPLKLSLKEVAVRRAARKIPATQRARMYRSKGDDLFGATDRHNNSALGPTRTYTVSKIIDR